MAVIGHGVRVSVAQRQARLTERHRLSAFPAATEAPAASVGSVAESLVALHATDPATVYLSAWARTGCAAADVDAALYEGRTVVRMLGMRRTVFVVPAGLADVVQAACTDDVAKRMRRGLEKDLAGGGVGDGDPGGWLRSVEDGVLRALAARGGGASGAELSVDEPRLRTQLVYAPDKSYGGVVNITSRVLVLIAAEGRTIRGHRKGGWTSGQFQWFLPGAWLRRDAAPSGDSGASLGAGLDAGAARIELARRWLRAFGADQHPTCVVGRMDRRPDEGRARRAAGDRGRPRRAARGGARRRPRLPRRSAAVGRPAARARPDADGLAVAVVVPGAARAGAVRPHRQHRADRVVAGRVAGGWAQRASGEVVYRLLEDIGGDGAAAVEAAAASLEAWLGASRVTPRFRTPLERELSA